jgi:putative endonuclease
MDNVDINSTNINSEGIRRESEFLKELYFVYILHCADKTYYVGMTNNLKKRIFEHNCIDKRASKYTQIRRPVKLMCVIPCDNYYDALDTEKSVRKLSTEQLKELCKKWDSRLNTSPL